MSTEIAESKGSVPALASTPATEITAEDVALPRLYLGQYMSQHVQEDIVAPGSIYTALSNDDPDPSVLWEQGDDDGVLFHVLALRKGKSISVDGELQLFAFDDPDAPADAWTTYNYVIVLPQHNSEVPYKWLLTRTGRPAAQQINMVLKMNEARGPAFEQAFEVKAAPRQNDKGKFFVPRVGPAEATPEGKAIAEKLVALVSDQPATDTSKNDEPDI